MFFFNFWALWPKNQGALGDPLSGEGRGVHPDAPLFEGRRPDTSHSPQWGHVSPCISLCFTKRGHGETFPQAPPSPQSGKQGGHAPSPAGHVLVEHCNEIMSLLFRIQNSKKRTCNIKIVILKPTEHSLVDKEFKGIFLMCSLSI